MNNGYLAGFFRNYQHQHIGLFRNTQCCPMAGAEAFSNIRVLGQWQKASGAGDLFPLDDNGAVMDRRIGQKDRIQEFAGDLGIDLGADLDQVVDRCLADDDDQRSNSANS